MIKSYVLFWVKLLNNFGWFSVFPSQTKYDLAMFFGLTIPFSIAFVVLGGAFNIFNV